MDTCIEEALSFHAKNYMSVKLMQSVYWQKDLTVCTNDWQINPFDCLSTDGEGLYQPVQVNASNSQVKWSNFVHKWLVDRPFCISTDDAGLYPTLITHKIWHKIKTVNWGSGNFP